MSVEIESGIPIPDKLKYGSPSWTLREMKPGQSVVIQEKDINRWRSALSKSKIQTVSRRISETEFRIWRVA